MADDNYVYAVAEGYFGRIIARDLIFIRQSVLSTDHERPCTFEDLDVGPKEMPNLPFAVMDMNGNAGSGKSYSITSLYQRLGGTLLCGATNAAADNISKRVENVYSHVWTATIHREIGFNGKHLSMKPNENAHTVDYFTRKDCTMLEFIRESLYKWWPVVSDIAKIAKENVNRKIQQICNSNSEEIMDKVQDLVQNSFRNRTTRLITSDVIVIDEAGLLCFDTLPMFVWAWWFYNGLYNTPQFSSSIPLFILVGSTAQTSAIENNKEVPSILNAIRWPCFRELDKQGWLKMYRFIGQKRCKDKNFNGLMTSLEYGKKLNETQIDIVDTMVRPLQELEDPECYTDYVRLFFSHREVRSYMEKLFNLKNITKFTLSHIIFVHRDVCEFDIEKWVKQTEMSNYSQYADLNQETTMKNMGDVVVKKENDESLEDIHFCIWQDMVKLVAYGPSIVCYNVNIRFFGFIGTVNEFVAALQSGCLLNRTSQTLTCERLLVNLAKQVLQYIYNWCPTLPKDEEDDDAILGNICLDADLLEQLTSFNELQSKSSVQTASHLKLLLDHILVQINEKNTDGVLGRSAIEIYPIGLNWRSGFMNYSSQWWWKVTPTSTLRTEEHVLCLGAISGPTSGYGERAMYEKAAKEVGCQLTCPIVQTKEGFVGIASPALISKYHTVIDKSKKNGTKQVLVAKIFDPSIVPFYAMTVKKSQGMTLDKEILVTPTWANGWTHRRTVYTGMSRTSNTAKLLLNRNPFKDKRESPDQTVKTHLYEMVWDRRSNLIY